MAWRLVLVHQTRVQRAWSDTEKVLAILRAPFDGRSNSSSWRTCALRRRRRPAGADEHGEPGSKTIPNVAKSVLDSFGIYTAETEVLRGMGGSSHRQPIGLHGENLDVFLGALRAAEDPAYEALLQKAPMIVWFDNLVFDGGDALKLQGHKLGLSTSRLYFKDKFLTDGNSVFSAENANEGILHVLFYLALFSTRATPAIFGIDNIEASLNPRLCTMLIEEPREAGEGERQAGAHHDPQPCRARWPEPERR